jgi:hypothetical protein
MNKQELTQAIEKAKRQLSLAKEQDEKDFAQKKIARLEKELSEIEKPKEEPKKKEEAKPKAEPKTESKPEAKTESKGASKPKRDDDDLADCDELEEREVKAKKYGYDLDELLNKAKEGKAKAKKRAQERANEPKKTPATRNREAVSRTTERVTANLEGRAKKGDLDAREIEKLIAEHEKAIVQLKKILASLKNRKDLVSLERGVSKMARGGGVEARKNPKIVRSYFEEEEFEYRRGGYTTPRTTGSDPKRDKMYHALPSGKRQSNRISEIEKRDGTSFMRRNANQYVDAKHSGNREYYESANNRSDKGKWY